ncbi:MAG: ribosome small subunit-dependent GTPase A [Saprospiraceae bacterium]|jgi:ribosome biogenesis GTPase|nr:ribosome small subunit-dependent GTPase A [Saprospiraceae bacterium]
MNKGTIVKSTGSWYQVRFEDGSLQECRIVGKLRLEDMKTTNPVAVGDEVMVGPDEEGRGLIREVLPRRNCVIRQSPRRKRDMHLLAANVDQALLITTIVEPNLKQGFIDRFLLMTEPYNIPTCIVFNKADRYGDYDLDTFLILKDLYEGIGYTVMLVSAETGDGVDALHDFLKDKITLVSGQSGVGKSTLVNAVEPTLDLRTGDISDHSGKGQHTTTFAEMFPLSFGGSIIDTPGIKMLAFNNLSPLDVAHNFREIFEKSAECRFGGQCLHKNEPKCAVKAAVESGEISPLRYMNYLSILDDVENQNAWEIHEM